MNNINFTPFPVIETDKFILRRPVQSDSQYVFKLRSDEIYAKYTGISRYETINEAVRYLDKINSMIDRNEVILWSIVVKNTNDYIGGISLWNISDDKTQAEIGYDLLPEFRGKGFIQEVIQIVINYAFKILNLDKIVAEEVRVKNIKSVRVLERSGFELERTREVQTEDGHLELISDYVLTRPLVNHEDH